VHKRGALFLAVLIVPALAVDEEDGEVRHVEVRDRRAEAGWERPGERHEQVTTEDDVRRGAADDLGKRTSSSGAERDPTSPR
jgi:hypothetical protein